MTSHGLISGAATVFIILVVVVAGLIACIKLMQPQAVLKWGVSAEEKKKLFVRCKTEGCGEYITSCNHGMPRVEHLETHRIACLDKAGNVIGEATHP